MRIAIVGSRGFSDYEYLRDTMNYLNSYRRISMIVCGCARGADTLGERWAKENNIPVKYFKPDWDGLGKRAGIERNKDMANFSDGIVAFWDGKSRGTKHMIEFSRAMNKVVKVFIGQKPWLTKKD